ncbi:MAG: hypothetical protein ACK40X_10455 [Armatimonadota bacterium]
MSTSFGVVKISQCGNPKGVVFLLAVLNLHLGGSKMRGINMAVLGVVLSIKMAMGQVGEPIWESQAPEGFQKWSLWDTLPDRPGLVRRFDVVQ